MAIILSSVSWSIQRARRSVDPLHPKASAQRSLQFTRAWSLFTIAMGLLLTGSFSLMQLSFAGIVSLEVAGIVLLVIALLIVATCVYLSIRFGQSGARFAHDAEDQYALARDDNAYWKCGVVYVNPDDPALFVPKRFGIGWTTNLGRPLSWLLVFGLLVLTAAIVAATYYLAY